MSYQKFKVEKDRNFTVIKNTHLREKDMSLKAKGLLTLLISLPDTWDLSFKSIVSLSKDSKDAVRTGIDELVKFGYITYEKERDACGRIAGTLYTVREEPLPEEERQKKGTRRTKAKKETSSEGYEEEADTEAEEEEDEIDEKETVPISEEISETPYAENPYTEKPYAENPYTENPYTENPHHINTYSNKVLNDKNIIELKDSINQSKDLGVDSVSLSDIEKFESQIKQNIDYDDMIRTAPPMRRGLLANIVDIMVDSCTCESGCVVNGTHYRADVIRYKLLKIRQKHLAYVLECIEQHSDEIKNVRQYILTSLFNSLASINIYYHSQVMSTEL